MIFLFKLLASLLLLVLAAWWINRGFRAKRRISRLTTKAAKKFEKDREQLEDSFNEKLRESDSGSRDKDPLQIALQGEPPVLASDLYAGELYALASVHLIDHNPSGNQSTAIFRWSEGKGGQWLPTDQLLVDVTPAEAMKRHRKTLTKL